MSIKLDPQQIVDAIWPLIQKRIANMLSPLTGASSRVGVASKADDTAVLVAPGSVPSAFASGRQLLVGTGVKKSDNAADRILTLAYDENAVITLGTGSITGGGATLNGSGIKLTTDQDVSFYEGATLVGDMGGNAPVTVYTGIQIRSYSAIAGREILLDADGDGDAVSLLLSSSSVAANTSAQLRVGGTIITVKAAIVEIAKKLKIGGAFSHPARTITNNQTATIETDSVILCDATSGAITVTLPAAAASVGYTFHVKKIDASGNTVTIDASGAETIDDALTAIITTRYESVTLYCDGTEWWIL